MPHSPRPQLIGALVLLAVAFVLAAVRSRRTGAEVGLVAVAVALFALARGASNRTPLRLCGAGCIVAVIAIVVEPHVH